MLVNLSALYSQVWSTLCGATIMGAAGQRMPHPCVCALLACLCTIVQSESYSVNGIKGSSQMDSVVEHAGV